MEFIRHSMNINVKVDYVAFSLHIFFSSVHFCLEPQNALYRLILKKKMKEKTSKIQFFWCVQISSIFFVHRLISVLCTTDEMFGHNDTRNIRWFSLPIRLLFILWTTNMCV